MTMDWINTDGSFGDVSTAPESVKEVVTRKGYKGIEDLATAYSNAEKKLGVPADRLLTLPDKEDDVEGWNKIYTKLGRPESPDKYEIKIDAGEVKLDDNLMSSFRKFSHQLGLSGKQANRLVQFQVDAVKGQMEAQKAELVELQKARQATVDEIKKRREIKSDEDLQKLILKAKDVAEKTGIYKTLENKGLSDDIEVVDALIGLSERLDDKVLPKPEPQAQKTGDETLKELIQSEAYTNRMHPDHKKVVAEVIKLCGAK